LGYISGDLFTNASGHPALDRFAATLENQFLCKIDPKKSSLTVLKYCIEESDQMTRKLAHSGKVKFCAAENDVTMSWAMCLVGNRIARWQNPNLGIFWRASEWKMRVYFMAIK
jgi:hypothetical protein